MQLLFSLGRQIPLWDRSSRIAFMLALVLLAAVTFLALAGPEALRTASWIGVFGLTTTLQVIVMWGNRHMVTPHTLAQRAFLAGDFAAACEHLESWVRLHEEKGRSVPVDTLVLLGNTYRSMGLLDDSLATLSEAHRRSPDYHFALYGLGRTCLARADYLPASEHIAKALVQGAPEIVRVDLALALYSAGLEDRALAELQSVKLSEDALAAEAPRRLMRDYLLFKLKVASKPNSSIILLGLQFWESESDRFAHTLYGQSLTEHIKAMQHWLVEE